MTEMFSVRATADIASVAAMARDIWNQHYAPIIGQAQTDYMLAKFQSASAIAQQIANGHEYYIAMDNGVQAGYCAIVSDQAEGHALLSKIYVGQNRRGVGLGKAIMAFVEKRCLEIGVRELRLTVNRHNTSSIAFYRHMGFTISGTVIQDIGHGFVMDDYKMVKTLGKRPACDQAQRDPGRDVDKSPEGFIPWGRGLVC